MTLAFFVLKLQTSASGWLSSGQTLTYAIHTHARQTDTMATASHFSSTQLKAGKKLGKSVQSVIRKS